MYRGRLVGLRVHVLWYRSIALVWGAGRGLSVLQKLQASLNVYVRRVEVGRALVCVQGIRCLVVARLVLRHC